MIRLIKNILGKTIKFIYRITYKLIPTHKKTILFIAFHGRGYSDNPRAIYEYMRQQDQFKDYRFIWAIKHHKKKNISIENAKVIEYFSIPYFFYLADSCLILSCLLQMDWRTVHDESIPLGRFALHRFHLLNRRYFGSFLLL